MATVKIILDKNETEEDAKELLLKALTQSEVKEEHTSDFHQPVARDVFSRMISEHSKMWERTIREISKVLDEEVE